MKIHIVLAGAGALAVSSFASAGSTTVTGVEDFSISTVFQSLFGGSGRSMVTTQNRWQVNGYEPGFTLGIYGVWDIDASQLRPSAGAASVDSIDVNIFPAVNQNTGTGGVFMGGDFQIWYTTNTFDIFAEQATFMTGGDETGLGDQFDPRTQVASVNLQPGIYDINLALDVGAIQQDLLDTINDEGTIRFLLTSTTPSFSANFGTGLEDPGAFFPFFGKAPTVEFAITAIPTPGAASLAAMALLVGARRRRA
ncbi:MAG: hypothetical protein EA379_08225 [Phycisphaerales bacterium]|nr:MAG: hypothetical protein EA379_08225 [Phycisphaerales bacterium]